MINEFLRNFILESSTEICRFYKFL